MKTERDLEQANWYSEARVVQRLRKARYLIGRPRSDSVVRCYLAGPMTGLPEFNFHAFNTAADILEQSGWVVFNPVTQDANNGVLLAGTDGVQENLEGFDFRRAMEEDLSWILSRADVVFLMPGWEHSTGARLEAYTALQCGIPCYSYPGVRPIGMGEWNQAYLEDQGWEFAQQEGAWAC